MTRGGSIASSTVLRSRHTSAIISHAIQGRRGIQARRMPTIRGQIRGVRSATRPICVRASGTTGTRANSRFACSATAATSHTALKAYLLKSLTTKSRIEHAPISFRNCRFSSTTADSQSRPVWGGTGHFPEALTFRSRGHTCVISRLNRSAGLINL